jgi:hypothetical protein
VAGVVLVESSHPEQFSHRPGTRESYEPQKQIFAVASLLARIGVVRLLFKLSPAPHELPQQQRAQIDALSPSTRQVSTYALELRATPQTTTQTRSLRSLGDKPLAVVSAGTQEPEWLELQDDLATLSSNSMHRVVEGATHTSLVYDRSDAQATSAAIVEVVGVAIFGVMALLGLGRSLWWIVAGWALHPLWDVGLHYVAPGRSFAPESYTIACLSFDLLVAAYIAISYGVGELLKSRRRRVA